jgi:hypothetical protein
MKYVAAAVLALSACAAEEPTYHGTVKDILDRNCVQCHQAGGIAPMPLTTYEEAAPYAEMIAPAVASRMMPPVTIDASGDCGTFRDVPWLTDDEIAAIGAWAEHGAPAGDASASTGPAAAPQALQDVGAVLDMGDAYVPSDASFDDYRCFLVDPQLDADAFLVGYEVRPGDTTVVHHVVLFVPYDDANEDEAQQLDDGDPGLGYGCFGGAGIGGSPIVAWAPGTGATLFPEGTGIRLPAGRRVVMQVHYNTQNGTAADHTTIDLAIADTVAEEAYVAVGVDTEMRLPPGERETTWSYGANSEATGRLRGVFPHMHTLGRTMKVTLTDSSGDERCVVDVQRWDFHWQRFFFFEDFVGVELGDHIQATCTYDTRTRDMPTYFGEGTSDEMCVLISYFTLE